MEKAVIEFANGKSITVSEGDLLFPIKRIDQDGDSFSSKWKPVEMWAHIHNGLIPPISDMLCSCEFFSTTDDCVKIYKSSAVLSIERV